MGKSDNYIGGGGGGRDWRRGGAHDKNRYWRRARARRGMEVQA